MENYVLLLEKNCLSLKIFYNVFLLDVFIILTCIHLYLN